MAICYYSAYLDESATQQSFFEMMSRKGYILRLKRLRKILNDNGTITMKGNCDTDLVVDAVARMNDYDTAVIMSGDSDFVSFEEVSEGMGIFAKDELNHKRPLRAFRMTYLKIEYH